MNGRAAGAATGYALRVTSSANRTTDYQNINLHNLTHTTLIQPWLLNYKRMPYRQHFWHLMDIDEAKRTAKP